MNATDTPSTRSKPWIKPVLTLLFWGVCLTVSFLLIRAAVQKTPTPMIIRNAPTATPPSRQASPPAQSSSRQVSTALPTDPSGLLPTGGRMLDGEPAGLTLPEGASRMLGYRLVSPEFGTEENAVYRVPHTTVTKLAEHYHGQMLAKGYTLLETPNAQPSGLLVNRIYHKQGHRLVLRINGDGAEVLVTILLRYTTASSP